MTGAEKTVRELLAHAGVTPNGPNPWDPQVHNPAWYGRVLSGGTLAIGESYMDGWWDVEDLSELVYRVTRAQLDRKLKISLRMLWHFVTSWLTNRQSKQRAFEVGERHYDIGNDLYTKMLDQRMVYTCAYWDCTPLPESLDMAQDAKLDLVCKKIGLKKGDRVLDIGGGWGSFAKFAAEKYGATVVAITVSKAQAELGRERCKGLPVEIRVQDYRDVTDGPYNHIVSLGMFEHVGYRNYRVYMKKVYELLKDDGYFLLHTIGGNFSVRAGDPWVDKYIFPNGMLPSVAQVGSAIEKLFVMEDWHNFGPNYDITLTHWFKNFDAAWPELKNNYSERFYRMWKYYLLLCAGLFRSRSIQLWQIVLSKQGTPGGYTSVR